MREGADFGALKGCSMLSYLLILFALTLAGVAVFTVAPVPKRVPWQLGLLAGEYGYRLAGLPVLLALVTWVAADCVGTMEVVTWALCALASGLLFLPVAVARALSRKVRAELADVFGPVAGPGAEFSLRRLWARAPRELEPHTFEIAPGLPVDFFPAATTAGRAPCVVLIHGGGWDAGDRKQMPELSFWLARRGIAVAAVSYRLAPQNTWPAPREDVLSALAWLKARASELAIDPLQLVLIGRSAGGQIALAAAYTADDPAIRGVVGLYAPSDLVFGYEHAEEDDAIKSPTLMRQYLGGTPANARSAYESASALNFVNAATPPTLLLHGKLDRLVWHRHSERLAAKLHEAEVPYAFVSLPWATHAFDYHLNGPGGQITTLTVEWFVKAVTGSGAGARGGD